MWLLCIQLILVKLVDMNEIYYEISSSMPSDMTNHKVSIFFTFNLYK